MSPNFLWVVSLCLGLVSPAAAQSAATLHASSLAEPPEQVSGANPSAPYIAAVYLQAPDGRLTAHRADLDLARELDMTPSISRHLLVGSAIGAALGAGFGLAVVALADCAGPGCTMERVVGVAGHAAAGAVLGAAVGGLVYLLRR